MLNFLQNQNFNNLCLTLAISHIVWKLIIEFVTNLPRFFTSNKRGSVEVKGNRNIISYIYNGKSYKSVVYKPINMRTVKQLEIEEVKAIKKNREPKDCTILFNQLMGPHKDLHGTHISTSDLLRNSRINIKLKYKKLPYSIIFNSGERITIKSIITKLSN